MRVERTRWVSGQRRAVLHDEHVGRVRAREALACSYNVPAIVVAARLGVDAVLGRLRTLGFATLDAPATHYGLALALGDGEVRLLDLANAWDTSILPLDTGFDNITRSQHLELTANLSANTQYALYDGNTRVTTATSDATGATIFILNNVAIGEHHYAIMDATLGIPYLYDGIWGSA